MTEVVAYEDHIKTYRFDGLLGWCGVPNIAVPYAAPDGRVTEVRHNSVGNRDGEHAKEKTRPRVAVVGTITDVVPVIHALVRT